MSGKAIIDGLRAVVVGTTDTLFAENAELRAEIEQLKAALDFNYDEVEKLGRENSTLKAKLSNIEGQIAYRDGVAQI